MALEKEYVSDVKINIREKIRKLFEAVRQQFGHQKLIEKCRRLQKKCESNNKELFVNEFIDALKYVLVYPEKNEIDNILSFVAKYVVLSYVSVEDELSDNAVDESDHFVNYILGFLFKTHGAVSNDVRLRCMQLLSKILLGMPENSLINDDVWEKLKETVLCRLQDKNLAVRAQAVLSAKMLQDPKNSDCEVIKALLFHFNDPSPVVRRAVVSSIALNKTTIGHVLARTRDINDNVRRNAYLVFSKIKPLNLTIKYRITIIERGLQDRSEMVLKFVEQILIINWLENFNKDIIKFLEALDVVNCSDIAVKAMEAIIKIVPMEEILKQLPIEKETRLIPHEKISPETVLFWRCLAHHFTKENKDEEFDLITPNLTVLCDYIRGYYILEEIQQTLNEDEQWTQVKEKKILMHLLDLIKDYDLSDEMGRSKLKELIIDMLISPRIQNNQIKTLVELMVAVIPNKNAFVQELTEVISEIRQPLRVVTTEISQKEKMDRNLKISDLKLILNDLREREYEAVKNKNYGEAQDLKEKIETAEIELKKLVEEPTTLMEEVPEEKSDPVTLCKCLSILVELIRCSNVSGLSPTLLSLKNNFLNQCMASRDLLTQSLAIEASAQFCILDKELAKQNLIRFLLMVSEEGDNEITIPSLKGVFDIIQTHGLEVLEELHQNYDHVEDEISNSNSRNEKLILESERHIKKSLLDDGLSESSSQIKCLKNLNALLYCKTNDSLKAVAFEGICKLLLSGIVHSSSILTRIIVKGFSPVVESESEDFIRQTFIVFFPIFAARTPRSQELIQTAFIPSIKTIKNISLEDSTVNINLKDVAAFLIHYTKPNTNNFTPKTLHVHNNLALSICHEIHKGLIDETDSSCILPIYLKALNLLEISVESDSFVQELQTLLFEIEKNLKDMSSLRLFFIFKKKINNQFNSATVNSVENTLTTTKDSRAETKKSLLNGDDLIDSVTNVAENLNFQKEKRRSSLFNKTSMSSTDDSSDSIQIVERHKIVVPESPEVTDSD